MLQRPHLNFTSLGKCLEISLLVYRNIKDQDRLIGSLRGKELEPEVPPDASYLPMITFPKTGAMITLCQRLYVVL